MHQQIWGGTHNGDQHFGKLYRDAQLKAAGFDERKKGGQPTYNGGVVAHREVRLQAGDKLYRFCNSHAKSLEQQACGYWWFDEEMCSLLWSLSDGTDAGFRQAARTMFAVLPEWSDMNFCVSGRLKFDHWAIRGTTARAKSAHGSLSNRHGQEARQLFVPGQLTLESFQDLKRVSLTRSVY
jgi:hypothetical protein